MLRKMALALTLAAVTAGGVLVPAVPAAARPVDPEHGCQVVWAAGVVRAVQCGPLFRLYVRDRVVRTYWAR